jgi:hypothetical protein
MKFDEKAFNLIIGLYRNERLAYTDDERKQLFELKRDCCFEDMWLSNNERYIVILNSDSIELWEVQPALIVTTFKRELEFQENEKLKDATLNRFAISPDEKMLAIQYDREILKDDPEDEDDTDTVKFFSIVWIESLRNLFDPAFPISKLIEECSTKLNFSFT